VRVDDLRESEADASVVALSILGIDPGQPDPRGGLAA